MLSDWVFAGQVGAPREYRQEPKLSSALFDRERHGFLSIASLPSNVKAVEASMLFAGGLTPLVALVGKSGWGKTHLLEAAAGTLRNALGASPRLMDATEWVYMTPRPDSHAPLLLDQAQALLGSPRVRQQARILLDWRRRLGKPTMLAFTEDKRTPQIRRFLPYPRDWTVATIGEPNRDERATVVRHLAASKGVMLSERVVRLLADRTHGTGASLAGCVHMLSVDGGGYLPPASVLRACGVLEQYLSQADGWDVRDHVTEAVDRLFRRTQEGNPKLRTELSVYLLLRVVRLGEDKVGSYFRLSPGEAYRIATRVGEAHRKGQLGDLPDRCIDAAIAAFDFA